MQYPHYSQLILYHRSLYPFVSTLQNSLELVQCLSMQLVYVMVLIPQADGDILPRLAPEIPPFQHFAISPICDFFDQSLRLCTQRDQLIPFCIDPLGISLQCCNRIG